MKTTCYWSSPPCCQIFGCRRAGLAWPEYSRKRASTFLFSLTDQHAKTPPSAHPDFRHSQNHPPAENLLLQTIPASAGRRRLSGLHFRFSEPALERKGGRREGSRWFLYSFGLSLGVRAC